MLHFAKKTDANPSQLHASSGYFQAALHLDYDFACKCHYSTGKHLFRGKHSLDMSPQESAQVQEVHNRLCYIYPLYYQDPLLLQSKS